MDIKIGKKPSDIDITECVVRTTRSVDPEGEVMRGPHFQAMLHLQSPRKYSSITSAIRFYSDDGMFLGLDEGYLSPVTDIDFGGEDLALSFPIEIPENAVSARFEITAAELANGYYTWVGRIGAGLVLLLLLSWILETMGLL